MLILKPDKKLWCTYSAKLQRCWKSLTASLSNHEDWRQQHQRWNNRELTAESRRYIIIHLTLSLSQTANRDLLRQRGKEKQHTENNKFLEHQEWFTYLPSRTFRTPFASPTKLIRIFSSTVNLRTNHRESRASEEVCTQLFCNSLQIYKLNSKKRHEREIVWIKKDKKI